MDTLSFDYINNDELLTYKNQYLSFSRDKRTIFNGTDKTNPFVDYFPNMFVYPPFRIYDHKYKAYGEEGFESGGDMESTSYKGLFRGFNTYVWFANEKEKPDYCKYGLENDETTVKILRNFIDYYKDSSINLNDKCYIDTKYLNFQNLQTIRSSDLLNDKYVLTDIFPNKVKIIPTIPISFDDYRKNNNIITTWEQRTKNIEVIPSYLSNSCVINLDSDYFKYVEQIKNLFLAQTNDDTLNYKFLFKQSNASTDVVFTDTTYNNIFNDNNTTSSSNIKTYFRVKGISYEPHEKMTRITCEDMLSNTQYTINKNTPFNKTLTSHVSNNEKLDIYKKTRVIENVEIYTDQYPNFYAMIKDSLDAINTPLLFNLLSFIDFPDKYVNVRNWCNVKDMTAEYIDNCRDFMVKKFNEIIYNILNDKIYDDVLDIIFSDDKIYDFLINSNYLIETLLSLYDCFDTLNIGYVPNGYKFIPNGHSCQGEFVSQSLTPTTINFDKNVPTMNNITTLHGYCTNEPITSDTTTTIQSINGQQLIDNLNVVIQHNINSSSVIASRDAKTEIKDIITYTTTSTFELTIPITDIVDKSKNNGLNLYKSFYLNGFTFNISGNPCACHCRTDTSLITDKTCTKGTAKWTLGTMVAFVYPYIKCTSCETLKNFVLEKLNYKKDSFNSKFDNYTISNIQVNNVKINNETLNDNDMFIFNESFTKSSIPLNLVYGCNVESDYFASSLRYNTDEDGKVWAFTEKAVALYHNNMYHGWSTEEIDNVRDIVKKNAKKKDGDCEDMTCFNNEFYYRLK